MEKTNDDFEDLKPSYTRKGARDVAFKLIFQMNEQAEEITEILEEELAKPYKPQDLNYLKAVVTGVIDEKDSLDKIIEAKSKGWKMDRISKVSLSVMRLALYEMLYIDDIPSNVSINEAVDLVKKYESPEAGAFINGILGSAQGDAPKSEGKE